MQLVDPACAAAQEHVETIIWDFLFLVSFSAKLLLGCTEAGVVDREINQPLDPTSMASVSHAAAGIQTPGSDERQLAVIGNASDHTAIRADHVRRGQ